MLPTARAARLALAMMLRVAYPANDVSSRNHWDGDVHYYDYETPVRLPDRDAFTVAEAHLYPPSRRDVAHTIVVAVTGPGTKISGFTWERAIAEGRALRNKLVEERRADVAELRDNTAELVFLR